MSILEKLVTRLNNSCEKGEYYDNWTKEALRDGRDYCYTKTYGSEESEESEESYYQERVCCESCYKILNEVNMRKLQGLCQKCLEKYQKYSKSESMNISYETAEDINSCLVYFSDNLCDSCKEVCQIDYIERIERIQKLLKSGHNYTPDEICEMLERLKIG